MLLWAREHETGVIVYSPMASGLLTGAFTAARAARLEPGDWRAGHPDFTEPALSANLALADALRPVAERHGVTPAAVAVAWTLAFPGVTGAIVGARSPRQVDGWLPAASLELKEDDLADIAAAIRATGAGTGPASPPLPAHDRRGGCVMTPWPPSAPKAARGHGFRDRRPPVTRPGRGHARLSPRLREEPPDRVRR